MGRAGYPCRFARSDGPVRTIFLRKIRGLPTASTLRFLLCRIFVNRKNVQTDLACRCRISAAASAVGGGSTRNETRPSSVRLTRRNATRVRRRIAGSPNHHNPQIQVAHERNDPDADEGGATGGGQNGQPESRSDQTATGWRYGQVIKWSLTSPVACMKA